MTLWEPPSPWRRSGIEIANNPRIRALDGTLGLCLCVVLDSESANPRLARMQLRRIAQGLGYIIDLLARIVTVSLEPMKIVDALPPLDIRSETT